MQAFVLIGSHELQDNYVSAFISDNKIPSYLIQRYEKLKIAEARAFQKTLSTKLPEESKRLIIISDPTIEAQNAILKTIEELSQSNYVFFSVPTKEDLLSTILSRSQIVRLGESNRVLNPDIEINLKKVLSSTPQEVEKYAIQFINSFGDTIEEQDLGEIILVLRSIVKKSLGQKKSEMSFYLLKNLSKNLYLTTSYNVQKKLLLENIFLKTLNSTDI